MHDGNNAKLKYKRALDPTVEHVKDLCIKMRDHAKNERLLLHYNGHGVPRPTANGEIWVFDKHHTQYIPLSVSDLKKWIGKPSIVVLDCSGAGVLMPFLTQPLGTTSASATGMPVSSSSSTTTQTGTGGAPTTSQFAVEEDEATKASRTVRDTIVLAPTSENELLPLNPAFPADIFTSCLTTPIPIALRWFVHQNPLSMENLDPEAVDSIPGKINDRKTPLGELNWIFTAITDTIAWNVLPSPLFQRLFRQDLLVASMFRNFLLADRILRSLNCTPVSHPALPPTYQHPLWEAWDLAVETCLCQIMRDGFLKGGDNVKGSVSSPGSGDGGESDVPEQTGTNNAMVPVGGGAGTGFRLMQPTIGGLPQPMPGVGGGTTIPDKVLQQRGGGPLMNRRSLPAIPSPTPSSTVTAPFFAEPTHCL